MNTNWDDLRFFLAVAREGTLSGAARRLKVNHSTVLRRISALQKDLGVQFFAREGNDRTLNQAGLEMLRHVEQIEASVLALSQRVSGYDASLSGTVRLTTTDALAATLVPTLIVAFRESYPDIHVNLLVDNAILSLTRDADIALRPARTIDDSLIAKKVCSLATAIFASPRYLRERGVPASPEDLWQRSWIVPDSSLDRYPVTSWMKERVSGDRVAGTSTSILSIAASIRHGIGPAVLPCFLGDTQPDVVRLSEPIPELESSLWLAIHTDLRKSARVRAFRDFALNYLAQHIDTFEGRTPALEPGTTLMGESWFVPQARQG